MRKIVNWLTHRYLPIILALLAIILSAPALWAGLQLDDHWHKIVITGGSGVGTNFGPSMAMFTFADGNVERTRDLMNLGVLPWWTLPELVLDFWRPVTVLTHWLDYHLWPNVPSLMHLQSLLWFAGVVAIVTLIYRRIMGPVWVAGLAALLYAIDDAHSVPAGWLANRNAVVSAVFGMATILLHIRWRRDGKPLSGVLAVVSLAIGLLAKEEALAACAYLFAFALFLDPGSRRTRLLTLAPYVIVVVGWRLFYTCMGFGAWGSESYIDPTADPFRFLVALVQRGPVLLLAQWSFPPSDLFMFLSFKSQIGLCLLAVLAMFAAWILLAPLLRRDAAARFWCVGMLLAVVPNCATFPFDRMLTYVGLGAMGLIAQFIAAVGDKAYQSDKPFRRILAKPMCILLMVVHLIIAPICLPGRILFWSGISRAVDRIIDSSPIDETITDKTLVMVDAPTIGVAAYLMIKRSLNDLPAPVRVRNLSPNVGLPEPIRLTRTDERTLIARPQDGYVFMLFRDRAHAFKPGDRIELDDMTIEVRTLTEDGWPWEVAFCFSVPLEDASLVWMQIKDNVQIPFVPPAVGETIVLHERTE